MGAVASYVSERIDRAHTDRILANLVLEQPVLRRLDSSELRALGDEVHLAVLSPGERMTFDSTAQLVIVGFGELLCLGVGVLVHLGAGEMLGAPLSDGAGHRLTVRATSPCELVCIPAVVMRRLAASDPALRVAVREHSIAAPYTMVAGDNMVTFRPVA
jgi:hypothetical protein